MNKPTIVIAEDDFLIREGYLYFLLEREFAIVAAVDDGKSAVTAVEKFKPNVVLMDVSLPIIHGFDAARLIVNTQPNVKVIFVSNYADKAYVDEAMRIGASGYVVKSRAATELVPAIQAALSGRFYSSLSDYAASASAGNLSTETFRN